MINPASSLITSSPLSEPLSLALSTPIKYISNCFIRLNSNKYSYPYRSVLIALSSSKIYIINNLLTKINFVFSFDEIQKMTLETKKSKSVVFFFNQPKSKKKQIPYIYLVFQERETFVSYIKSYYSSYYAVNYYIYKEVEIYYTKEIKFKKNFKDDESSQIPLMHCPPEMFKLIRYKNFYFFASPNFSVESSSKCRGKIAYDFHNLDFVFNYQLNQVITEDISDVKTQSQNYLNNYLYKNYKGASKYYFIIDEPYTKKYNFNEDVSKYICYYLKCVMRQPEELTFDVYMIRRLYEPPFFETFSDFFFLFISKKKDEIIIEGEENKNSIKIQNEMQLVVDSFYIENIPNYYEFAPVINLKFDSLTYNYNIMKYIITETKVITSREILDLGIKFVLIIIYDFICALDENKDKTIIDDLTSVFLNVISSFKMKQDDIEHLSVGQIFIEFENFISKQIKKFIRNETMKVKSEEEWDKKVKVFLLFCLNGGICGDAFDLKKLLSIKTILFQRYPSNINTKIKRLHDDTIIRLIFNGNSERSSNFQSLMSDGCNVKILSKIITYYTIANIFDIQDEVQFFVSKLDTSYNYKILKRLIKKFDKFVTENQANQSELVTFFTKYSELKVVFVKILKQEKYNSKSKICACKGLIYFANYNENKVNFIKNVISLGIMDIFSNIKNNEHDRTLLEYIGMLIPLVSPVKNTNITKKL